KMRCRPVGLLDRGPMPLRPFAAGLDFSDRLAEAATGFDWDREPLRTSFGLDPVSVVPVAFYKLGTVVHDVLIAPADQVEKTLPGNVAGLDDRNAQELMSPRA